MAYEPRPGDGSLFINDKQREGRKDPDRTGQALIHCPHCSTNFAVWVAGWLKETPVGKKFLSLSITSKGDPGAYRGGKNAPADEQEGTQRAAKPQTRHSTPPPPSRAVERPMDKIDPETGNYIF